MRGRSWLCEPRIDSLLLLLSLCLSIPLLSVFRLFRSLEYLQDALQSFALADAVERVVSVLKGSSLSVWLLFDHVQWLQKAGYLKLRAETLAAVDRYHSEAWFSGLLFGALLCLYRLQLLVKEERLLSASATPPSTAADILHRTDLTELRKRQLLRLQDRKAAQVIGVVKNMTDLIIPAARLRWLLVSDGTVGLAGSITSCIGVYQTYPKR
jgi:peroxin-11B